MRDLPRSANSEFLILSRFEGREVVAYESLQLERYAAGRKRFKGGVTVVAEDLIVGNDAAAGWPNRLAG
mgnify:CR=1 FL=1